MTKREGDGSLDRGACAIRITRPRARASPLGHRLNCDPAGAMRGRDGAGERKAGRAEMGSSEGWFSAPSLSRSALALLRRAEVGVAPWKEDGDARGGSRVAAGAIRLRPKVSAREVHTRA